jgi:hypothetical protein
MADNVVPESVDGEGYGSVLAARQETAELFGVLMQYHGTEAAEALVALHIGGPKVDEGFRAQLRKKLINLAEESSGTQDPRPLGEGLDDGANLTMGSSDHNER